MFNLRTIRRTRSNIHPGLGVQPSGAWAGSSRHCTQILNPKPDMWMQKTVRFLWLLAACLLGTASSRGGEIVGASAELRWHRIAADGTFSFALNAHLPRSETEQPRQLSCKGFSGVVPTIQSVLQPRKGDEVRYQEFTIEKLRSRMTLHAEAKLWSQLSFHIPFPIGDAKDLQSRYAQYFNREIPIEIRTMEFLRDQAANSRAFNDVHKFTVELKGLREARARWEDKKAFTFRSSLIDDNGVEASFRPVFNKTGKLVACEELRTGDVGEQLLPLSGSEFAATTTLKLPFRQWPVVLGHLVAENVTEDGLTSGIQVSIHEGKTYVSRVEPRSPAYGAGLRLGDLIHGVAGKQAEPESIETLLKTDTVELDFQDLQGKRKSVSFKATGEKR